jgi:glutamate synthase (NADPH/NADH) large chain
MTDEILNQGEQFVTGYKANVEALTTAHAYNPADEHDACGVGLIAAIDGKPRRSVVEKGIEALKAVWHRGAVDADGKTGDGAGIHVQVPQQFFHDYVKLIGHIPPERPLAVGQVFLPRLSLEAQERCRCIVETEILNFG